MLNLHNYDLHNHSVASDGLLEPAALIALAAGSGCDAIALTDHDTTAGLDAAASAAVAHGIHFIRGVEISVSWPNTGCNPDIKPTTIHIVGLNIEPAHEKLVKGLDSIRAGRLMRAKRMDEDFQRVGIDGMFDEAYALAENKSMIGRTHFARALARRGIVKGVGKAFERYLTYGKPGYVAHQWTSLEESVDWIVAAGGVAVLAHPGRYKINATEMRLLLGDFCEAGGRGIEVVTGSHQPHHFREYAELAREFGLLASRGADYHGPGESSYQPGELPPLPANVTPVWSVF